MTYLRSFGAVVMCAVVAVSAACSSASGSSGSSGGSSGSSGGGSSGSSGADAGGSASDGGSLASVAPVDVTFAGSCPAATPCGGAVLGTWDYTGVCVDDPLAALKQQCPTATVESQKGTVKGRVAFAATTVKRTSTFAYTASVTLPAACSFGQCATLQQTLAQSFKTASCKAAGGGCACDLGTGSEANQEDAYAVDGNTINIADGSKYDFCVAGGSLSYTPRGNADDAPGAYTLTKR
jgi:hypothetical protein